MTNEELLAQRLRDFEKNKIKLAYYTGELKGNSDAGLLLLPLVGFLVVCNHDKGDSLLLTGSSLLVVSCLWCIALYGRCVGKKTWAAFEKGEYDVE